MKQLSNKSKEKKIKSFNPNSIAQTDQNIFGLPFSLDESEIVILPVPWDVTTSFMQGTAKGPESVFEASFQVDLYDPDFQDVWKKGIFMKNIEKAWVEANKEFGKISRKIIKKLEKGYAIKEDAKLSNLQDKINRIIEVKLIIS